MLVAFIRSGRGDARGSEHLDTLALRCPAVQGLRGEDGKNLMQVLLLWHWGCACCFYRCVGKRKHRKYGVCPNQICCHNLIARSFPGEVVPGSSSRHCSSPCNLSKVISVRMPAGRDFAACSRASLCWSCCIPCSRTHASFQQVSLDLAGRSVIGVQKSAWPAESAGEAA